MIATNALTTQNHGVLSMYSAEDLEVIRNHVASPDFSDSELAYCLSVARARGLDPLQKQVYFTKRKKKCADGNYSAAVTVEPTIDGYRAMAERTGELEGYEGPFWCGEDGVWKDAWLTSTPPVAAKIIVHRKGKEFGFSAVARYAAYMQGYDNKPNTMWQKMGDNQLAKCAEALALRKAFPSDLGAFYTREEMGQADTQDRFASLPQEERAPPTAKPQVIEAPKVTFPPVPDQITTIPLILCRGVFKPLAEFDGVPLRNLKEPDLEMIISLVHDNRGKVVNEVAKSWLTAIEAEATIQLRDAKLDSMEVPQTDGAL